MPHPHKGHICSYFPHPYPRRISPHLLSIPGPTYAPSPPHLKWLFLNSNYNNNNSNSNMSGHDELSKIYDVRNARSLPPSPSPSTSPSIYNADMI